MISGKFEVVSKTTMLKKESPNVLKYWTPSMVPEKKL